MLKVLLIKNFRNLEIANLKLEPGTTIIIGENGQGKTNFLEAINTLSYGKSFRAHKQEAINWQNDKAAVVGTTNKDRLEAIFSRNSANQIKVNGRNTKAADFLGRFVSVVFHPEEIDLVSGVPDRRRAWLDRLIATTDKNYLYALVRYQKSLVNKNRLLKEAAKDEAQIEIWNKSLAKHGTLIWRIRRETIANVNEILNLQSRRLTKKTVFIEYKNPIAEQPFFSEKAYLKKLEIERPLEQRLRMTVYGPHRDDFKVIMEEQKEKNILQKSLADYGSRAEQRQAVILMKLAEAKFFGDFFGEAPTMLLDDVASELDHHNRDLLLAGLYGRQIFITTTELDNLPVDITKKATLLNMTSGQLTKLAR
ncbi:MAG: DNA replication and repair protein RecF [bacterium]|nr:DNA replication and repair protein RecF [bacterium]